MNNYGSPGAGEVLQFVKCLLHKVEVVTSDPHHFCENLCVSLFTCDLDTGEAEIGRSLDLAGQLV